ncbi:MAG: hypothetical protein JO109_16910, partial [Alphaproteobacteria bacterium]|nr:hypothetical protein [Alphaproteobacteria bacterium]
MMDQDGLSIALALMAIAILGAGLWTGSFHIQFFRAERARQPVGYWVCAAVLLITAVEAARRAIFVGCV